MFNSKSRIKFISIAVGLAIAAAFAFWLWPDSAKNYVWRFNLQTLETETLTQTYTHQNPHFSFQYPEGFNIGSFQEGEGETVLVQQPGENRGFQIYILPFDEPGPITKERIWQDIPDKKIVAEQKVKIGGEDALVFLSQDPSLGATREAWFIHVNFLFQISAQQEFDETLSRIMATFKFLNI